MLIKYLRNKAALPLLNDIVIPQDTEDQIKCQA